MPTPSAAILRALRRPGDEAQWTQVIAALASHDARFAGALAKVLVAAAPNGHASKLAPVPERLLCRAEDTLQALFQSDSHGRVDLRFQSPEGDFVLLVELKLHSGYGHDQVDRYLAAIAELPPESRRGLVAITRNVPGVGEPPGNTEAWLGSIRWADILGELRDLPIENADLARQWQLILDLIEEQGDFGMTMLDRDDLYGWAHYRKTRDHLSALIDDLAPHALQVAQDRLAPRPAWSGREPSEIASLATRGGEGKIHHPTQETVHARLEVPGHEGVERLRIQFLGGFDDPLFTVEARRPGTAALLAGMAPGHERFTQAAQVLLRAPGNPFRTDEKLYWARVHEPGEWLSEDGSIEPGKLRGLVESGISELADSGILDPDAGFEADQEPRRANDDEELLPDS